MKKHLNAIPGNPVDLALTLIRMGSDLEAQHAIIQVTSSNRERIAELDKAAETVRALTDQCEVIGFTDASLGQMQEIAALIVHTAHVLRSNPAASFTTALYRIDYLQSKCMEMSKAIIDLNSN